MKSNGRTMLGMALAAVLSLATTAFGATALSIGGSKTATVAEDGNTFTIKVNKGAACTLYIPGTSATIDSVDVSDSYDYEKYDAPSFTLSTDQYSDGTRAVLSADDWDTENSTYPSSITYYVSVSGEAGESFKIYCYSGAQESVPTGIDESHAASITPSTTVKTATGSLADPYAGAYYFKATLKANTKYYFGSVNGTESNSVTLTVSVPVDSELPLPALTPITNDTTATWSDSTHDGYKVVPTEAGTYLIEVSSSDATSFKLTYKQISERLPAAHSATDLGTLTTEEKTVTCAPGARNDPNSGYFDAVIDNQLFKANLVKGTKYLFWMTDASVATNYVIEVYDAKGNVLVQSKIGSCNNPYDGPMAAYAPTANGTYWIGVCQSIDDEDAVAPVSGVTATFGAKVVTAADDAFLDAADQAADNVNSDVTALTPVIGAEGEDPFGDDPAGTGVHTFSYSDWTDTYRIDARKGVTYSVVLMPETVTVTNDGVEATVTSTCFTFAGALTAGTSSKILQAVNDLTTGLVFTATANQSYYITVTKDAQGAPAAYSLHTMAFAEGGLGTLTVNIFGPSADSGATWTLVADGSAPKYVSGASILIPAGTNAVKFASVRGWSTPTNVTGVVATKAETVLSGNYNDTFDTKDDTAAGATSITPAAAVYDTTNATFTGGLTLERSLWSGDAADWFKFNVSADNEFYYCLALTAADKSGANLVPVATVYDATLTNAVASAGEFYLGKGTYYIKVDAGTTGFDGTYSLRVGFMDYGGVKFDKASYSVAENAAAAVVKVNRTGKSAISVRFTTKAGTALPGVDYKPVTEVLTWAANDKTAKTISIPLIPDLYATYESNKTFTVELSSVVNDDGTTNSYPAIAAPSNAVVTLTESSRIAPGTLGFSGYESEDGEETAFANAKKPAMIVAAGEAPTLYIARTGGSDGKVGVKVETVKGTAAAGTDFENVSTNLYWEDGDASEQAFTFSTMDTGAAKDRAMTVKLTALTGTGLQRATLGASSVAVTIRNPDVDVWLEETLASKVIKGTKGVWYFSTADGSLMSMPIAQGKSETVTCTVPGPGRLTLTPVFNGNTADGDNFVCTFGKTNIDCTTGAEITLYLGKGNQTLKFVLTRGKASENEVTGGMAALYPYTAADGNQAMDVYDWLALKSAEAVSPANKAVIDASASLTWDAINTDSCIGYLVYADTNAKLVGATNAAFYAETYDLSATPATPFEAGKAYSWRVNSFMTDANGNIVLVNTNATWQFTVAVTNAVTPALYAADGTSIDVSEGLVLVQGLAENMVVGNAETNSAATYKILSGKLPDGIKLAQDRTTKAWTVSGVPTKAGTYTALLQALVGRIGGAVLPVTFTVEPIRLAEGTFNGIMDASTNDDQVSTNVNEKLASVTFTATAAGRLSAKVQVGTKSYSFSGTGFTTNWVDETSQLPWLGATLSMTARIGRSTYTNTLDLAVCRGDGDTNNCWLAQLGSDCTATLAINLPTTDNKGVQTNLAFEGEMFRNNQKDAAYLAAIAPYVGYYTVSLPAGTAVDGAPQGAGLMTVTVDAKGGTKLAGTLADGTTFSGSTVAAFIGGDCRPEEVLAVPVFTAKNRAVFGGWLFLKAEDVTNLDDDMATNAVVVSSDSILSWSNADPNSTYSGENGFDLEIDAVGGFYDKLFNLQRFYLNRDITVDNMTENTFPDELFTQYGTNYDTVLASPSGLALTLVGDSVTVSKRSLVKQSGSKLTDLGNSVNAANFNVRFTRATGLFNGTFSLWLGDADVGSETVQKEVTNVKYQGVLTPYKASGSDYGDRPGLGFFQVPVKIGRRTWTGSWLFSLLATDITADNEAAAANEGDFDAQD